MPGYNLFRNKKIKVNTYNSSTAWKVTQKGKKEAWLGMNKEAK